jgi:6-phosphogluconolactonase (cycloisomerase 2 family)
MADKKNAPAKARTWGMKKAWALLLMLELLPGAALAATAAIAPLSTASVGGTSQVATADGNYVYQLVQNNSSFTAFQVNATNGKLKKLASYTYSASGMQLPPSFQSLAIDNKRKLLFAFEVFYGMAPTASYYINVYRIGSDGKLTEVSGSPFPVNASNNKLSNSPMVVDSANGRLFLQTAGSFPFSAQYQCDASSAIVSFTIADDGTLTQAGGPTNTVSNAFGFTLTPDGKYLLSAGFNTNNCGLNNSSISGQLAAYPVLATGALGTTAITQSIPILSVPLSSGSVMTYSPVAVVADPGSSNVYLLNNGQGSLVFSLNGTAGSLTPNTAIAPLNAYGLVFSGHGRRAWALANNQIQAYQVNADGSLTAEGSAAASAPSQDSQGLPPAMLITADSTRVIVTNDNPQSTWVYGTNLPAFGTPAISLTSTAIIATTPVSNMPTGCTPGLSVTPLPGNGTVPAGSAVSASATLSNGVITGTLPVASMPANQTYNVSASLNCGAIGTFSSAPLPFNYYVGLSKPTISAADGAVSSKATGYVLNGASFSLSISTTAPASPSAAAPGAITVPLTAGTLADGTWPLSGTMPVATLQPNIPYYVRTAITLPDGSSYFSEASTFSTLKDPSVTASFSYPQVFSLKLSLAVNPYSLPGTEFGFILSNPADSTQQPIKFSFTRNFSGTTTQTLSSDLLDASPTSTKIPYLNGTMYKMKGYVVAKGVTYESAEVDVPVKSPIALAFKSVKAISAVNAQVDFDFVIDHARVNVNNIKSVAVQCTLSSLALPGLPPTESAFMLGKIFEGSAEGTPNVQILPLGRKASCKAKAYMQDGPPISTDGLTSMEFDTPRSGP